MSNANGRELACSFYTEFVARFEAECEAVRASMIPLWEDSAAWTRHMLASDSGLLVRVATDWAQRGFNVKCDAKGEWSKFDLMLLDRTAGDEWWLSVPLATIEHENGDAIQDEVWKLACWTSRLKVLVTYDQTPEKAEEKRARAARIIRNIHPDGDVAEWLMMSAPRKWGERLAWEGYQWGGDHWVSIST